MSHYAKRNPENPHGLQGGHFPAPPSKYQSMSPEEVLDRMAQDNAQDRRYVEHGPAMLSNLRAYARIARNKAEAQTGVYAGGVRALWLAAAEEAETLIAKVEGKD